MASYDSDQINSSDKNPHGQSNTEVKLDSNVLSSKCRIHTSKRFKSFCGDHDELVCEECVYYDHRRCNNIVDLDRVSKGVKQCQEYQESTASLHNLKDDLEKLKVARENDKIRVDRERKKIKNKMQEAAEKVKVNLTKLLKEGNENLDRKYKEFEGDIDGELKILEQSLAKVTQKIDGLQADEKDAFIKMKTNRNIQTDAKKTIKTVSEHVRNERLKYTVNTAFDKASTQTELGRLSFENENLPPRPRLFHEVCEYDANLQGTYNVNMKNDSVSCHILDSCLLNDGSMVLTDLNHNLLLNIDQSYKIAASCEVLGKPWGVCSTSNTEVAVTLIGKQTVQFVAIDAFMELKHNFKVGRTCRGILFKDGNLFVCCGGGSSYWRSFFEGPGEIRVYSLQGIPLTTFQNDENGRRLFGRPRDIIINPENNLFYITDETNGVIILNRRGQKLSTITDKNLTAARGITFDNRGQLFVGCFKSNHVLLFDGEGVLIHIPVTTKVGVLSVRSLCLKAGNLVVTGENDAIQVFDLARRY
ncbi:uncharacterized protein LOC123523581 [Mercenaria mercenaria]|uniref:uncharacterized protein LOC123523581 n=1 Tax=Mercenaria mercenaria TaxID=6596 RepID=UPI00234F52B8|nr:uncharacterized protein LOC123523581 [Mercenaria mercenaria]